MHTFTISGSTYLPNGNSLYLVTEEVTAISGLEEDEFYLHEGMVGTFELPEPYRSSDAIFHPSDSPDTQLHYTVDEESRLGDSFTSATVLERIVPDQLVECPNCGSSAGSVEDSSSPSCFQCGYGTEEGIFAERDE